jgi:hypothetical protein
MNRKLTGIGFAAVLALAACGGTSTAAAPAAPPTAASIAAKAGCTGWTPDTGQLELYVKESGTCTVNGQPLNVDTYNNTTGRDGYLKIGVSFGGSYGQGPLWVTHGDDAAAVATAVAAAGGTTL